MNFSIAVWFIPVALGIELGNKDLIYSLILTAFGLYFAIRLEFRPALKALIWAAFSLLHPTTSFLHWDNYTFLLVFLPISCTHIHEQTLC